MSMDRYVTIGFGLTGEGMLPIQQQWYDAQDYDSLNGGELPGFPLLEQSDNSGEMDPHVWSIFVKKSILRIHRYEDFPTDQPLYRPTNEELDELREAGRMYIPTFQDWEDSPDTDVDLIFGTWHVLMQVL